MRTVISGLLIVILVCGCDTQSMSDVAESYAEEVEIVVNRNQFLMRVNSIGDDSLYSDPLKDSLKFILLKDSIFNEWLDDPNVVELGINHVYWSGGISGSDPYGATFKALPLGQSQYLHGYAHKENIKASSYEIASSNGTTTELSIEAWCFTQAPEFYFGESIGYIEIKLTLTDVTGSNSTISDTFFTMLILVPQEHKVT